MKICFPREYSVENALARAFTALGHQCIFVKPSALFPALSQNRIGLSSIVQFVQKEKIDLVFFMSNAPIISPQALVELEKYCLVAYWERQAPTPFIDQKQYNFKYHFTAYSNGPGIYLPGASDDHSHISKNIKYEVSLIGMNKINENTLRGALHKRIETDIHNRYSLIGNIPYHKYDDRFYYMASSLCSIGIWNTNYGVPLRFYELASTATPILTYPFPLLRKHFTPGLHYIETESLSDSLDYYKKFPKLLSDIGQKAYCHLINNHTYIHRAKSILKKIGR